MLIHLPIVVLASVPLTPLPVTAVADSVPKFDIAHECQSEGGAQAVVDRCKEDEATARGQLGTQWDDFGAGDKSACIRETSVDGSPSYVELLTCLEMAKQTKTPK
jgi:hypothetical protein